MYTREALLDIHERTHRSLERMLAHCGTLAPGDLDRELPGFGYPTVRLQCNHVIGAEQYWMRVIAGSPMVTPTDAAEAEDESAFPDLPALAAYRERVAAATRAYLEQAAAEELNTPRPMVVWGGGTHLLAPARVLLRTQTHVFQHLGQMNAMCRVLGRPAAVVDFPIA